MSDATREEMMIVAAARTLQRAHTCFVGIGLPNVAANLARLVYGTVLLIYESGPIGAKPSVLPLSIGDGELADTADTVVPMTEIFGYWLQAGRIDVGFLGAAQIDRFANLNTTVIGPYDKPRVRLPGAGGAPDIAANAREVIVLMRQRPEAFVAELDFLTSAGFLTGGDARAQAGYKGGGPSRVITDLGKLVPDPVTKELTLASLHPGVTVDEARAATGWPLRVATSLGATAPPSADELAVLRDLVERTAKAHATA